MTERVMSYVCPNCLAIGKTTVLDDDPECEECGETVDL